ncbi:Sulfotransferase domain-containing protein [Arboricoccus pini]|uniref:Sulfotransferase domain-containing protein n=1 Tax=Arboricoccus pini TaxID=1963835 RepID=A0A212RBX2_9PROT|nr:sulfotransferase domain-containing protein [Arboricoccus pini]SNB69724.1 Sulfotransferase domain-containing protein [Arboricoccus pini]
MDLSLLRNPENWRDIVREVVVHGLVVVPRDRRRLLDRRWRGLDELRRLGSADTVIVSYGKSGRTWLRVMVSRYFQRRYALPEGQALEFDNLYRLNPRVPRILFTHANYIRDATGHWDNRAEFRSKRVLLLVRDPVDTAVSQYYQWRHRMRGWKKILNDYPPPGAESSIFDFVMSERCGLPKIVDYLAVWERELPHLRQHEVVSYEEMRKDAAAPLMRVLRFFGEEPSEAEIADAVAYGSLENMRALEATGGIAFAGRRMKPGSSDPQSFKTRRGKVGGWRDEFTPDQIATIEAWLAGQAPLPFGY